MVASEGRKEASDKGEGGTNGPLKKKRKRKRPKKKDQKRKRVSFLSKKNKERGRRKNTQG